MAGTQEEKLSFGNFSIETLDGGLGSAELAEELLSPETSTASPDDVTKIDKEKEALEKRKALEAKNKAKETPPKETAKSKEEEEEEDEKPLKDFLGKEGDEEEEEEETVGKKKPIVAKKETKEEDEEETSEEDGKDNNKFSVLSKDLYSLNVFTKDEDEEEEEITTPQALLDRFNLEKRKGAEEQIQNFLSRFGEDYQSAFQAIFVKGVNPKDYFGTYNTIENYSQMDLTNESHQTTIVRQALLDQGMEPADAEAKIEKLKSYGDLEDEAHRFHKVLVKKEAAKIAQLEQDSEAKLQLQTRTKQQYAQNVSNILNEKLKAKEFDGIPINPKLANELADFLITDKYKTSSGETLTEFDKAILELKRPENHAQKVKVGLLLKMLETDPKLTTLLKTATTKKADQIFENVIKNKVNKETNKQDKPARWFV